MTSHTHTHTHTHTQTHTPAVELVGGGGDLAERAAVAAAAAVFLADGVEEDAVPIPCEMHVSVWEEGREINIQTIS